MTKIHLITGFLGSGKTTLLKNLLKQLTPTHKIAIIQNEFASTGLDGKELKSVSDEFKLIEINNGSIFCVCQLSNFISQLNHIIEEYNPDIIFIETSGLADPIAICELMQADKISDKVSFDKITTVVDCQNFFKGLSGLTRFKHQLMVSDNILLNKIDIKGVDIDKIESTIKELNPYSDQIKTIYSNIDWVDIDRAKSGDRVAAERYIGEVSEGAPSIKATVLRSHDKIKPTEINSLALALQKLSIRAKGIVNLSNSRTVSIQTIYNQIEITEIDYIGSTEIVAFGSDITIVKLKKLYKLYTDDSGR